MLFQEERDLFLSHKWKTSYMWIRVHLSIFIPLSISTLIDPTTLGQIQQKTNW